MKNKISNAFVTGEALAGAIQHLRDCEREFIAARSYHYDSCAHMYCGSVGFRAETVLRVTGDCGKMCIAGVKLANAYDAYIVAYRAAKRVDNGCAGEQILLMCGDNK